MNPVNRVGIGPGVGLCQHVMSYRVSKKQRNRSAAEEINFKQFVPSFIHCEILLSG